MLPPDQATKEVVSWVVERADGGRGFGFDGGHFARNWGNPDFRRLVVNALLWTARVEVPKNGAKCEISSDDLTNNMDQKPAKK
jgi:type 1 glutamine amidotransferase